MDGKRLKTMLILLALANGVQGQEAGIELELPGGVALPMVWIEAGQFLMGAADDEPGRFPGEGPRHEVAITRGFYLGKFELTQGQWEAVMGTRPWTDGSFVQSGDAFPAVYISWLDVQEFLAALNQADPASTYRLPTEAEWEYAARAGTQTIWSFGNDGDLLFDHAWFKNNAWDVNERYAHQVGRKRPNPWGLFDIHGNVWEWTADWYDENYYSQSPAANPPGPPSGRSRVVRGGYFHFDARATRSAARGVGNPAGRDYSVGMRLLREGAGITAVKQQTWGQLKDGGAQD